MVSASYKQILFIWSICLFRPFDFFFFFFPELHLLNHSEICFFFSWAGAGRPYETYIVHIDQIHLSVVGGDRTRETIVCIATCSRITIIRGSFYSSSGFHWSVWMFFTSSETDTVDVYTFQPVNGFMWSHKTLRSEFENHWVHRAHIHIPTAHIQYL